MIEEETAVKSADDSNILDQRPPDYDLVPDPESTGSSAEWRA